MKTIRWLLTVPPNFVIIIVLIVLTLFSAWLSFLLEPHVAWLASWLQNLSAGIFGSIITFWLLEVIVSRREERWQLMEDLRSHVNSVAVRAAEKLQETVWLRDGSLHNIVLAGADLRVANLSYADLQGAIMWHTKLQGASLLFTNLKGVDLSFAEFDEQTQLPDGSYWQEGTDMSYFVKGEYKFEILKWK